MIPIECWPITMDEFASIHSIGTDPLRLTMLEHGLWVSLSHPAVSGHPVLRLLPPGQFRI